jgi:hypothetical protein
MCYTREQFRELCVRTACIAAVATLLTACGQTVSTHATGNATGAATQQGSQMEEIVITASRGHSPKG